MCKTSLLFSSLLPILVYSARVKPSESPTGNRSPKCKYFIKFSVVKIVIICQFLSICECGGWPHDLFGCGWENVWYLHNNVRLRYLLLLILPNWGLYPYSTCLGKVVVGKIVKKLEHVPAGVRFVVKVNLYKIIIDWSYTQIVPFLLFSNNNSIAIFEECDDSNWPRSDNRFIRCGQFQ